MKYTRQLRWSSFRCRSSSSGLVKTLALPFLFTFPPKDTNIGFHILLKNNTTLLPTTRHCLAL